MHKKAKFHLSRESLLSDSRQLPGKLEGGGKTTFTSLRTLIMIAPSVGIQPPTSFEIIEW